MVEDVDLTRPRDIFDELSALLVVSRLDGLLVGEELLDAFVADVLESVAIEFVFVFVAAEVGDGEVVGFVRSLVRHSSFPDEDWGWKRPVFGIIPVVQCCLYVVLLVVGAHCHCSADIWCW